MTRPRAKAARGAWLAAAGMAVALVFGAPRPAAAYSVLAHEANIDALWTIAIAPMLRARYPDAGPDDILEARAYAYGGCVIQDLGYYPFGSHFFSDLLHYVRTGDFVTEMLADATDVNDYAFAIGALAHYAADNAGHPLAVNRAVPLMYPELKSRFGSDVTYAQAPKNHVLVEFSFDVVQVASSAYAPEVYHSFIGFKVSKPLLERAFAATYGLPMKELFLNVDLAIGTYRHAVATTIPEMTKIAWNRKRDAIEAVLPGAARTKVVFNLKRGEYDKVFGVDYEKPHGFARFLAFMYRLIPKVGPFRALSFSVPTPEAERLFLDSFTATRTHFRESLDQLRGGTLRLANTDFDTGNSTAAGEYSLADKTYDALLEKLASHRFAGTAAPLREDLLAFYGDLASQPTATAAQRKRRASLDTELALLKATSP